MTPDRTYYLKMREKVKIDWSLILGNNRNNGKREPITAAQRRNKKAANRARKASRHSTK